MAVFLARPVFRLNPLTLALINTTLLTLNKENLFLKILSLVGLNWKKIHSRTVYPLRYHSIQPAP